MRYVALALMVSVACSGNHEPKNRGALGGVPGGGFLPPTRAGGGGGSGSTPPQVYISVKDCSAVGDGVVDDTAAIQTCLTSALTWKAPLYFPRGTYKLTRTGSSGSNPYALIVPNSTPYVHLIGDGATLNYGSTVESAFLLGTGIPRVIVEGLSFQGANDDDKVTNIYPAFYVQDNTQDLDVVGCTFKQSLPLTFVSSDTSARLLFARNRVIDAPNGTPAPNDSTFVDNWFVNTSYVSTRSHALYGYGHTERMLVHGNHFKNITAQDIQIRAGDSRFGQKYNFSITENYFENSGSYSIWIGSDTDINLGSFLVQGNQFKNVHGAIQLQGARDTIVDGNEGTWDYEYSQSRAVPTGAVQVTSGINQPGEYIDARNIQITNNKWTQRHPFFSRFTLTSLPHAGDQITIGSQVYTFQVAAPSVAGQVQIGSSVDDAVGHLIDEVRGHSSVIGMSTVLRDSTDIFGSQFTTSTAGQVIVVSAATFTLTTTSARITITQTPFDNRTAISAAFLIDTAMDIGIRGNTTYDIPLPLALVNTIRPRVTDNKFVGASNNIQGNNFVSASGNVFGVYERNTFMPSLVTVSNPVPPSRYLSLYDAFPTIRDNAGVVTAQEYLLQELSGGTGSVLVGDRQARTYLYYGAEVLGATVTDPQTLPYRWSDGDTVVLSGIAGNTYTFTFKRSSPGANQFNTYATLLTLIDSTADYDATTPTTAVSGDPFVRGYMLIKAHTAGTAGNSGRLAVTTRSQLNGIILRDLTDGEAYARFIGGAATAISTPVFSPQASTIAPLRVSGYDATSAALAPSAYQADTVPGVAYVITHSAAAGTERFYWRVE